MFQDFVFMFLLQWAVGSFFGNTEKEPHGTLSRKKLTLSLLSTLSREREHIIYTQNGMAHEGTRINYMIGPCAHTFS
jgi:hypothetical protein